MNGVPDRRYFTRVGTERGFRAAPLETVFRLARLLGEIDAGVGDELCLRGGTALNLLHLDVPRLSVDIDVDFVGSADAEQAQQRRPELLAELVSLARRAGYDAVEERASYAMAHLRLPYSDIDGRPAQLKLDVNFLDRVPLLPPERLPVRHPFGDDLPEAAMQTLAVRELAAAKTIALARRGLARDLFDVAMLADLGGVDDGLLRTAIVVRGAGYPRPSPLDYSVQAADAVRAVRWRSEVLPLVRRPVPFTLELARERAAGFLRRATDFDEGQRAFLQRLDVGRLEPERLERDELRVRVEQNPALQWRLRRGAEGLEER